MTDDAPSPPAAPRRYPPLRGELLSPAEIKALQADKRASIERGLEILAAARAARAVR